MGKLSSERCALAVIVRCLEDNGLELPVKNTFIHFPLDDCAEDKIGVHRWKTDPSSEPRTRSRLSSLDMDDVPDVAHSQISTTSGSSTPRTSTEDGAPTTSPQTCVNLAAAHPSSTYAKLDGESMEFSFSFMLRRAGGVEWGLAVTRDEERRALLVDNVLLGGAIEAWNRQVMDGPKADKALLVGDLIVSINGKKDCQAMVDECRSNVLLKMEVIRQASPLASMACHCDEIHALVV